MYFEAKLKGIKYKINVVEDRHQWKISIEPENSSPYQHTILKSDYKDAETYISFLFKGTSYLIDVIGADTEYTVFTRGSFRTIPIFNDEMLLHESLKGTKGFRSDKELRSGMPGKVIQIFVKPGDDVKAGQPLLIMEAMKMENEMRVNEDVKIKEIFVKQGDSVETHGKLMSFE